MATSVGSDLLSIRKETKARLSRLKGAATYDALLQILLELAPEDEVVRRLHGAAPRREARERPPEKQLQVARLAAERWRLWTKEGRVVQRGPRLYTWNVRASAPRQVTHAWQGRRGLPP